MKSIKNLLDETKKALNVESDYALAKEMGIPTQRISAYYAGKETPNEFICLKLSQALQRPYEEVQSIVRIEAEKDEKRRQAWKEYYKSIGGVAASIMLMVFASVTLLVTSSGNALANQVVSSASKSPNTNYAFFERKIKGIISLALYTVTSWIRRVCFAG